MHYDVVIIGGGLSGLAAGVRLSHYGKKALILESHYRLGGLNSFYTRDGRTIDVGLHAMTNFVPAGTRGAPLTKLLRQLRIRHEELELVEQSASSVRFPANRLDFANGFTMLRESVGREFPEQLAGFDALTDELSGYNETALDAVEESARERVACHITDPVLADMLFCPLMYYGNPAEHDMDWSHFAVMWKSVFTSGFCRPRRGMKYVIELLGNKYRENGGELRLRSRVVALDNDGTKISSVELENGEKITAGKILSSAGYVETMQMCGRDCSGDAGKLSFSELVVYLDCLPAELGLSDSIVFFNDSEKFKFQQSGGLLDPSSGVICCPNNFNYDPPLSEGCVRVTMKAGYEAWAELAADEYSAAKKDGVKAMLGAAEEFLPGISSHVTFADLFTPLTIERFTAHAGGAIYGSARKFRPALTDYDNLFLIGTDQGFLGIVGSLLSGITVANLHGLE